jgi:membrane protein
MKGSWAFLKETVYAFLDDDALSRGAAMAFYAVTALAPVMLIVISIAGLAFGEDAARNALTGQFQSLMGKQSADLLQSAVEAAGKQSSGIIGTVIGLATLLITASGVFGEMQAALNKIWQVAPTGVTVSRLLRARIVSLGLVATLGFLMIVSLVISTALSALGDFLNAILPSGKLILSTLNEVISFGLIAILFGAIYKILPDKQLHWNDVMVGAAVTTVLFGIGKSLIGLYLGSSAVASTYGAAGGLMLVLLWTYYSSQVFLLGAEITKVYTYRRERK